MIQPPGKITPKPLYDPEDVALLATLKNHFQSACDSMSINNKKELLSQQRRITGFTTSKNKAKHLIAPPVTTKTFQLKYQQQQQQQVPEQAERNLKGKYIFGLERHLSRDNNQSTLITDSFIILPSTSSSIMNKINNVAPSVRPPSGYLARRPVSATVAGTRLKPASLPRPRQGQKQAEPAEWTKALLLSSSQQDEARSVYLLKKL
jgi:hypothetical protein